MLALFGLRALFYCYWLWCWCSLADVAVSEATEAGGLLHPKADIYNGPVDEIKNPKNRVLTPHTFKFILNNPDICRFAPAPLHTLVVVHSSPDNWKRRMSIRRTWTTVGLYRSSKTEPEKQRVVVSVFVMGRVPDEQVQRRLAFEHSEFGDIVQEDFLDSYKNLTYKNQLWMRFAKQFCPNARFVVKSDDDMHINMVALLDHLDSLHTKAVAENGTIGKKLWCCRWDGMPVLRDAGKWHVPKTLYKADFFPPYCSGSAYVVTIEAAIAMFEASLRVPFFWVDDVWATGLVPPHAGVQLADFNSLYVFGGGRDWTERFYLFNDKKMFNFYIFGHFPEKVDAIYALWHNTLLNSGIRIMDSLPVWTWYQPNTYLPTDTYVF